jgi:hypothetical protein
MSAHGGGTNPILKALLAIIFIIIVVGSLIYFFDHFPMFDMTNARGFREIKPAVIIAPSPR